MSKISLGNRMKRYEQASSTYLTRRTPVIIRVDGKAFHTLTARLFGKRWDADFTNNMAKTAQFTQQNIQGCRLAYCQSDEISFLLTDYTTIRTEAWFEYKKSKVETIAAALAASQLSVILGMPVQFDARAFNLPKSEIVNYFVWRQQDATSNAIQMAGREYFSDKALYGKSCDGIQELLLQKCGMDFNSYPTNRKRGFCVVAGAIDNEIPVFTQDRSYIQRHVYVAED